MQPSLVFSALASIVILTGCGTQNNPPAASATGVVHDLNTPEGAILSLEDAYKAKDIEAAVRCRDFAVEARLMLQRLQSETDLSQDEEVLAETTKVLNAAYRAEISSNGFPDFRNIESTFSDKQPFEGRDDIVALLETCKHSDGTTSSNKMIVVKTAAGWKVISVAD